MEKVLGIIAEYSPFHNGHLYHLEESKKALDCKYCVAIISGNFMQRGIPSLIDKFTKTKIALSAGIDLVLELPTIYSISSSENFAYGAVGILNSLGIVDYLSFGSEIGEVTKLDDISNILANENHDYKQILNTQIKKGLSYPKARENAITLYTKNKELSQIISTPNNILGIEYLKALKKLNSKIIPYTLKRNLVKYHSTYSISNFASSSAIRKIINENNFEDIKKYIPESSYNLLKEAYNNGQIINGLNCFEKEIIFSLRKMTLHEIKNTPDVNEGLEYAIKEAANQTNNLDCLINKIKSKRYTLTRLQRILIYVLLGITKQDMDFSKNINNAFIRILGISSNGKNLLSKISNSASLPVITSVKKFLENNNNNNNNENILLNKDILATNVYTLGYSEKNNSIRKSRLYMETLNKGRTVFAITL